MRSESLRIKVIELLNRRLLCCQGRIIFKKLPALPMAISVTTTRATSTTTATVKILANIQGLVRQANAKTACLLRIHARPCIKTIVARAFSGVLSFRKM